MKAIIFDCFGVLIGKGFHYTYQTAGGDPIKDRDFIESTLAKANLGLISDTDFREIMAQKVGVSLTDWNQSIKVSERLDIDLLKYIQQLRRTYKTAILSNANKQVLDQMIGKEWLQKDFDEVIVSAEVGLAKPDPRVYQLVVDRLGVTPQECLYIDDRSNFVMVARSLGMRAFLYKNFPHFKRNIPALLV